MLQPLPTLPDSLLTYPKAEQHEEPEPQPCPQCQRRGGGGQAHHLPVAPGLGGEGNMVRRTEPEDSQHPPLCLCASCLLPPPQTPSTSPACPLPSAGTCCFPGGAAPRPALRQGQAGGSVPGHGGPAAATAAETLPERLQGEVTVLSLINHLTPPTASGHASGPAAHIAPRGTGLAPSLGNDPGAPPACLWMCVSGTGGGSGG